MSRIYIHNQREENHLGFQKAKTICDQFLWNKMRQNSINQCPSLGSRKFVNLVNSSKYHFKIDKSQPNGNDFCSAKSSHQTNNACIDYSLHSFDAQCKQTQKKRRLTSMLDMEEDSRSAEKISNIYKALSCEITNLSKNIRPRLYYEGYSSGSTNTTSMEFDKINGLACKTNRTLSLVAMDSLTYELIAERLGIELKESEQNTAAVIIDNEVGIIRANENKK